MEAETNEAVCNWLATFQVSKTNFLDDPLQLLDGVVLCEVYNQLSDDEIPISNLKQVSSMDDWINIMLNVRQITGKITPVLKAANVDVQINISSLSKKDPVEFHKFLKYFVFYSVKAPNRKESIKNIRSLDKTMQGLITSILEEYAPKKPRGSPSAGASASASDASLSTAASNSSLNTTAAPQNAEEDALAKKKIQELDAEIAKLESRKAELDAQIAAARNSTSSDSSKISEQLSDAKRRHQHALEKRDNLNNKLDDANKQLNELRIKLDELRAKESELSGPTISIEDVEVENIRLKKRLEELTANLEEEFKGDTKRLSLLEKARGTIDVAAWTAAVSNDELEELSARRKAEAESSKKLLASREADLRALRATLETQNRKSAAMLRRRIAALEAAVDKSAIGDARRMTVKCQRAIARLESEIKAIQDQCGSLEVSELQRQLQLMAERKAAEGDLLARKQAHLQAAAEQCGLRLQRQKLNVSLQMHSSRVKRWKNCFLPPSK